MRALEIKDNELYLDGEQLKHLTEFRIDFVAGDAKHPHSCELYAKGVVVGAEMPEHSSWAYYTIEEQVELVDMDPYGFKSQVEDENHINLEIEFDSEAFNQHIRDNIGRFIRVGGRLNGFR